MQFKVSFDGCVHEVGNKECKECWDNYPITCNCGGLIHADFGDENSNGNYWLYYKCDLCGEESKPEEVSCLN